MPSCGACSQQYHTLNGDFLINGAVAWRDNQPGGFTFHLIFLNSKQGDDFVARCKAEMAAIDAAGRTKDIEAELALVKADLVAGRVDAARQSHVCALVAWLENNGHTETDN